MDRQTAREMDGVEPGVGTKPGGRFRRWGTRLAVALAVIVALAFLGLRLADQPRPALDPSPEADELARRMMDAVNTDAWQQTGAVSWGFGGRQDHLWDRRRHFARVSWDETTVLLDLTSRKGVATENGNEVQGTRLSELENAAWSHWCNDSFWLNPVAKLFDAGTSRGLVAGEDGPGLLVQYDAGGVTPGDAYLWIVGDDGLPTAWKMWTQILPLGGVHASWDEWQTLSTGARVATLHQTKLFDLRLTDVTAAPDLAGLMLGQDPFLPLVERLAERPSAGR